MNRCAKKKKFIHFLSFLLLFFLLSYFFLLSSSTNSLSPVTPSSLFLLLSSSASSPHGFGFLFSFFLFSVHFLCASLSLSPFFSLSLSLSLLSTAFTVDLHNPRPIPFTTTHLVMTESSFASTITPSPSLPTLMSTKKKAILIRYLRMCWRDSDGGVIEETVAKEHEEGDFGVRL